MTKDEYNLDPKLCLHCNSVIPFERRVNKFCNSSCSATFNNTGKTHSAEHKAAIAASVNRYNESVGIVKKPKERVLRTRKVKAVKPKRQTNALTEEKEKFQIERYQRLYPDVKRIVGVYEQKHTAKPRAIMVVEFISGDKQTRSYPRAIMEIHLGRVLDFPNETVDHVNSNPMDNRIENLQILSLRENILKGFQDGTIPRTPKGVRVLHDTNGSSNGMSKLTEEQVLMYRRQYTAGRLKNSIIDECELTRKTVENFLFGKTYKLVPEVCTPRPYERNV